MNNNTTYKEKRRSLIEEREADPDFASARRLILVLLVIMIFFRILHVAVQMVTFPIYDVPLRLSDAIPMAMMVIVVLVFSKLIYSFGSMPFVYLAFFGGCVSFYFAWRDQLYLDFIYFDLLMKLSTAIFTFSVLTQIVVMLTFIFNGKCKSYFSAMREVTQEIKDSFKAGTG